jgi:N-acetylglucosamine-6-sulfatase
MENWGRESERLYFFRLTGRELGMKKSVLPSAALVIVVLLSLGVSGSMPRDAQALTAKPNFVFILADDMRKDDLAYMPKTRALLKGKGMSFDKAFVSNAVCCPSRATIMRGQYSHNTGVLGNKNGPHGGLKAYKRHGNQKRNVATRLHRAGYRTALIGKYLNGYDGGSVPPGWNKWFARWNDGSGGYFNYDVNDNGTKRHYGSQDSDYATDVLGRETKEFIDASVAARKPFFAYVAPKAPHEPSTPAPRDQHTYDGLKAARSPSFNEKNVSDKPPWIRRLPKLSDADKRRLDQRHERRAESLGALDDLVAGVVGKLKDKGKLGNTYIFFTSDNGWDEGEHRIPKGKQRPYEEDIHMPLLVRGPGIAPGSDVTRKMVLNTDYFPTFMDLAGIKTPDYVDGRSLRPVLKGTATKWRTAILLEGGRLHSPAYRGIRTSSRKYIAYEDGKKELYRLGRDRHELNNKYSSTSPPARLVSRLRALKSCAAATCRAAENGR